MNLGQKGEELACGFLVRQGLVLVEKNFRLRLGEVDLIMREGETLVFVEVKYRSSHAFGGALAAVTPRKQRKVKLVAEAYLQRFSEMPIVRFDVVGISPQGSGYRFDWVKGAFE
jgi:putative endonuclease